MKIQQFLQHHGLAANPFADEDAQTDLVFKGYCIRTTYHPTWDKIYGNPAEPATAVVFGEKGAGKTALRLQIARHLGDYNADHQDGRVFVIQYDDFNPFLDRFRDRFLGRRRRVERVLAQWKLWDHMDAILSLGVTQMVDRLLERQDAAHPAGPEVRALPTGQLDASQKRDILLLAACYDRSSAETTEQRWHRLRRKLAYPTWLSKWDLALGAVVTVAIALTIAISWRWSWLGSIWTYLLALAGWAPWLWRWTRWSWRSRLTVRNTRVLRGNPAELRRVFMNFPARQIVGQPIPDRPRTDDRYALLSKFQGALHALGFHGIVVLVDRVDEPYLINGSADLMRALLWPMLDNKLLKHPGIGFKLLLPADLATYVEREGREFHQRARLDKQNVVPSLEWTGQSLYDLACARLKACAIDHRNPILTDLFDETVGEQRLIDALRGLRVPRQLFKFLYRVIVAHINAYSEDAPVWKISGETFQTVLALYQREQEAFNRGVGIS
jgi:hypothetical protein